VIEMTRRIISEKNKCYEEESIERHLEEVYGRTNLKDAIHLELLKEMI
jgi:hypothetical protein